MLHRHKAGSEYYALKIKNQAVAADAFSVAEILANYLENLSIMDIIEHSDFP